MTTLRSVISFTAPRMTEEEEEQEIRSLTEEERRAIHEDIYGNVLHWEETEEMRDHGREELEEALRIIPANEKEAYLEALERSPELVARESDSFLFLRCEKYNVWAAATRLVKYWAFRKKIFRERAFLPLTLTGNGAMLPEDVEVVSSGGIVMLPEDASGRTVLYFDFARINPALFEKDRVLRLTFFMYSCAAIEHVSAQKNGFVLMAGTKSPRIEFFDRKLNKEGAELTERCFPMTVRALHLASPIRKSVVDLVLPIVKKVLAKGTRRRLVVHAGTETEQLSSLAQYGLSEEGLPDTIGGSWKYEQFEEWVSDRIRRDSGNEAGNIGG